MLVGDVLPGVNEYRVVVRVNGAVRAVESVSWSTEMVGDLPDQVIASGGLGGASGTIDWAPQEAVQSRPVSPWAKVANWPPSPGDLVQVQVSDGVTTWTRFTGVVDKTSGDAGAGYQSSVIDFRDRISGSFSHLAILRHMTPLGEGGDYRSVGLNFWFPLTMALRSCGFFNVPPVEAQTEFSMPLQGSVYPEAGNLADAGGSASRIHAAFFRAPWGYAAGGFSAALNPRIGDGPDTPIQLTMMLAEDHAGVAYVQARFTDVRIRLRASSARGVEAYHIVGTTETVVVSLGPADLATATTVTLLVKDGVWRLRADNGAEDDANRTVSAGSITSLDVSATDNARIAGVQVSRPNSTAREFASLDFAPSMRFQPSGLASTMDAMPALRGRDVAGLVDEILSATLTAAWWDEEGVLVLDPSDRLRGRAPVAEVSTAQDITSLAWEDSLLSVRSRVEVEWKDPAISKGRFQRLELWRARSDTLDSASDPIVDFVSPESGMEWFGVDRAPRRLNSSNWGVYNSRRGSFCGVWLSDADGNPDSRSANISITHEPLYSDSLKITTTVNSMLSSLEANTETHPEAVALRSSLRGQSLPVVRGMGRLEWIDAVYTVGAGPSHAPALTHDLGYWGGEYAEDFEGGESVAQRIGDYLAQMVTAPQPTITGLGVIYDPRRQVGDVYTLRSEWLGIALRVLVVGISEDHGDGSHQSLTVRVISATSIRPVTYDDLAAAWDSGNYTSLNAAWAALTYNDFAADPLEGAPS